MFERRKAYNKGKLWSKEEEEKLFSFLENNSFDSKVLLKMFPDRTLPAVRSKTRKLRIKEDIFGKSYRRLKQDFTDKWAKIISPSKVFEAYAGAGHQSEIWINYCNELYASDKGKNKKKQFVETLGKYNFYIDSESYNWTKLQNDRKKIFFYSGDVIDAAMEIRKEKINIDVLDLDTCGSTLPILPLLLNLIKPKYLLITHGEFHSLRFKRDDVLRRVLFHRDVTKSAIDLSVDELSYELDKAVKVAALRVNNETKDSFSANLIDEIWLGSKFHGMLRRVYKLKKASATADILNELIE